MNNKINYLSILFVLLFLTNCSTKYKVNSTKKSDPTNTTVNPKSAETDKDVTQNREVDEEEVAVEFIDNTTEEEFSVLQPPKPQVNPNSLGLVPSDLRKEFPRDDHIRIAKKINIDIEEIYYYHNRSQVLGIYINTDKILNEAALKEIQEKIYSILWDFSWADITSIFKHNNKIYNILSSRKKYGTIYTIAYDYKELKDEFAKTIASIQKQESYQPFLSKELYGVFIDPGLLNTKEKSDLTKYSCRFIFKDDEQNYSEYYAERSRFSGKVYTKMVLGNDGYFYNYDWGNTITVCPDGALLSHSNEIEFKTKYSTLMLKID